MNVLYLTYDGLTDPLGQSQVLPYVVGLSKKGLNFTLISFEKKEAFKLNKNTIKNIVAENGIHWKALQYTKKPPFISTLFDIYQLKKTVKLEIKTNNIKLIHCRSYITAIVGLWAKRKYNVPYIFDMRGFWADERLDGGIWSKKSWIQNKAYNYFKRKEKEFLQHSAHNISLTYNGTEEIESWKLKKQSPIAVIPCCADEKLFNDNNEVRDCRADLGVAKDAFVLSYLGSIGTWYMLDEMLDFFKELQVIKPNSKFLFITKDDKDDILKVAVQKGIDSASIIVISANRNEVPAYIKASNFSIFFIKPFYSKKASSPTKMGEIMNMGVPIVCNTGVGDVDIIMKDVMPDFLVNSFDKSAYNKVLTKMFESSKGYNSNALIEKSNDYYSLSKGIEKYYQVYKSILT